MKNVKLTHFAVALMMVLQWSCATTEIPQASEQISKTDLLGGGSMLEEYKTFKIDGVITSDTKKITAMMNNSQVTIDNPEEKEISFYTSEASYRRFNPEIEQVTESVQATAATTFPDTFTDLGNFSADYSGITGLGTILDQGYFRNYANNIYFINSPNSSSSKYFIRIPNLPNFNSTVVGITINGSTGSVSKFDFNTSATITSIKSGGTASCIVKNDTNGNRYLDFYELVNYGGRKYRLTIPKDSYFGFAPTFSTIGGTCRSIYSVAY